MNITPQPINVLLDFHTAFSKLPVLFRERVCEECNYSTATFYRKMREVNRLAEGKQIQALSNAEKEKIKEIAQELTNSLLAAVLGTGKGE